MGCISTGHQRGRSDLKGLADWLFKMVGQLVLRDGAQVAALRREMAENLESHGKQTIMT